MSLLDFDTQMGDDIKGIFLKEFAQTAIFESGGNIKEIVIQFFEEPLDKLGTQYYHAWCDNKDVPYVSKGDTLTILDKKYGIVDFSPDEFQSGLNLFLNEV